MTTLEQLIGTERAIDAVSQALFFHANTLAPPAVGAMHVTCADESEHECAGAFQRGFAHYLLPQMKFAHRAPFRIANLGANYEWGAVRIAEDHFATPKAQASHKLMVVKINAHVAVESTKEGERFGRMNRYERPSACCGALDALLHGDQQPFVERLRDAFISEGKDRVATLLDEEQVAPEHRSLFAAIASARLQARQAMVDIQDYQPRSPTVYLVLPCVTLNRKERDTEILCGMYTADHRTSERSDHYTGLADDPRDYRLAYDKQRLRIEDDHFGKKREARDHRQMVLDTWRARAQPKGIDDPRLEKIRHAVDRNDHHHHHHGKALLKGLLVVLGELAPGAAAVILFAEGVAGIHNAYRAQRVAHEVATHEEARLILDEIHDKVDTLDPERARAMVELLMHEYRV